MAIIKNELPILEYDPDPGAVLAPTHERLPLRLPEKAVFAFLGGEIEKYAFEKDLVPVSRFVSATKRFPVFVTEHRGQRIALCQAPVGSAPAAQLLDWLIGYGAREIISAGSCGALCDIPENTFLVPVRALRDEGASYHYLPPARWVDVSPRAAAAVKAALSEHGENSRECLTWSTDGFFRETAAMAAYRRDEGCEVVEMECASLAAVAQFRGACWGELLFTADSLADAEKYDERGWGGGSFEYALRLCLDAVTLM